MAVVGGTRFLFWLACWSRSLGWRLSVLLGVLIGFMAGEVYSWPSSSIVLHLWLEVDVVSFLSWADETTIVGDERGLGCTRVEKGVASLGFWKVLSWSWCSVYLFLLCLFVLSASFISWLLLTSCFPSRALGSLVQLRHQIMAFSVALLSPWLCSFELRPSMIMVWRHFALYGGGS